MSKRHFTSRKDASGINSSRHVTNLCRWNYCDTVT